jgi:hypothetical protein
MVNYHPPNPFLEDDITKMKRATRRRRITKRRLRTRRQLRGGSLTSTEEARLVNYFEPRFKLAVADEMENGVEFMDAVKYIYRALSRVYHPDRITYFTNWDGLSGIIGRPLLEDEHKDTLETIFKHISGIHEYAMEHGIFLGDEPRSIARVPHTAPPRTTTSRTDSRRPRSTFTHNAYEDVYPDNINRIPSQHAAYLADLAAYPEPDYKTTWMDFECKISRQPNGVLNGYVIYPEYFPAITDEQLDGIRVHGGITFENPTPPPFVLGFSLGHEGDYVPLMPLTNKYAIYRTMEYAQGQCIQLCMELEKLRY